MNHDGEAAGPRAPLDLRRLLVDVGRFLAFRKASAQLHTHARSYLAFGLVVTWLVGVGRYWDSPRAELWQHLGVGSLAYVFSLALVLWLLVWPLRPQRWTYFNVLLFVTLCSPPALLYAVPVERFLSMHAAQVTNAWFLAVVAAWRVALLVAFLRSVAKLSWPAIVIATLLPLALIVVCLMLLNLEHVVFNLMAGIRESEVSSADFAYGIVVVLSALSYVASPFLLLGYVIAIVLAWRR